ncbi:class I SAM-dependent methyltransferase [Loktanella sp. IMCC34160]|uniref:class I SAM-dependent methyltransferase n=1 Tax=Loktanella sp. IMCC34160 TaxID=2510646 RepID=UPI0013ECAB9E|nr:class I SAM-dependent methyltransferase [Loktanella sp. IMCC34160]
MAGFFRFLRNAPSYHFRKGDIQRLNKRHRMIIEPIKTEIAGSRILDIAAHDGRWCTAYAAAGAREVIGIEARPELVQRFQEFPQEPYTSTIDLRVGEMLTTMEEMVQEGETFDIVSLLGIFYHTMEHQRLLNLASQLKPKLIVIDGEFALRDYSVIILTRERTDNELNTVEQVPGQEVAMVGIPSPAATEAMAAVVGYACTWADWDLLPIGDRQYLDDYFRTEKKRRRTCFLQPSGGTD